jgi:hypothetical protein
MRGSGSIRPVSWIALCLAVLVPLGLLVAASAGAATISSFVGGKAATPALVTAGGGACPSTVVMVNGTGFVSDGGVTNVTIGGVKATDLFVGSNVALYARVGAGATTGPVTVTTPAGTATSATNAVVLPCQATGAAATGPKIQTATPGKVKGGTKIHLLGNGFVGTTSVTVDGIPAAYAIPTNVNMLVIVPKDAKIGKITIKVTNSAGTAQAAVIKVA